MFGITFCTCVKTEGGLVTLCASSTGPGGRWPILDPPPTRPQHTGTCTAPLPPTSLHPIGAALLP